MDLFVILYKGVETFKVQLGILKSSHSVECYGAVLYCCGVYYAVQGGSKF